MKALLISSFMSLTFSAIIDVSTLESSVLSVDNPIKSITPISGDTSTLDSNSQINDSSATTQKSTQIES